MCYSTHYIGFATALPIFSILVAVYTTTTRGVVPMDIEDLNQNAGRVIHKASRRFMLVYIAVLIKVVSAYRAYRCNEYTINCILHKVPGAFYMLSIKRLKCPRRGNHLRRTLVPLFPAAVAPNRGAKKA